MSTESPTVPDIPTSTASGSPPSSPSIAPSQSGRRISFADGVVTRHTGSMGVPFTKTFEDASEENAETWAARRQRRLGHRGSSPSSQANLPGSQGYTYQSFDDVFASSGSPASSKGDKADDPSGLSRVGTNESIASTASGNSTTGPKASGQTSSNPGPSPSASSWRFSVLGWDGAKP
ncbi:hypothetical protein I317_01782 [Kwoniella heveanensis CBS 569]|uniref:Uncharacterized protein n=1 Tax=Kwoniella heveanensis BCC8398 TaxID=1296120 RepID=A0A1B9GVM9_9TREE|nr:hypothetical protein I316_03111 [Kwoniella heveanensis BCC8398]OCF44337.1 hypothetical protein I317_01782 [Kwoniella heveanensis CBS 569]